ncbi:ABC-type transport auxiliary lipoprotein family protein [Verminephrobacter aporrectodeae]|uniref:ABC-type transport auxiliary lipoprotein family protein n=1 Tax=Verminephrobacter aporrectodeae TaxID=1110389 RepID=UPI002243CCDB|nr:ABC-type transport auxiliary lipoprotein family protein [Verminephrobacter aporrectodeae]MCW8174496.1 hypothetical protein [Verminephrobacter aporrectodeae subsp. tuberculatae]MCW8202212.1 hypothetical protein [Verminephrobacter aporrectodeae subsp. tuberculatae]MCW8208702.1 hypothetical protein [Verminephrobacter aporrectodeae subsp. tuberculatae]
MNAMQNTAAKRPGCGAGRIVRLGWLILPALSGCSTLLDAPVRPVHYDFGPSPVVAAPAEQRAPLPALALADVQAPGLPEGSSAVLYRLAYADARQLHAYSQARWSQPPAQLLQQRLRERLGQRRAILRDDDAGAPVRDTLPQGGRLPLVLRVELEEFSQRFSSPTESAAVVQLRATLIERGPVGETLRGQRVFSVQRPAGSADAVGGVAALVQASTQLADELAQWVEQIGP